MRVEAYNTNAHYYTVLWMLKAQDAYCPTAEEMPLIGLVAFEDKEPIAAAFLRRVEGGFAQLDGLVTNPQSPSALRHEAIDTIVSQLLDKAKDLKIKSVLATTRDENTLLRATRRHGFKPVELMVMVVDPNRRSQ